MAFINYSKYTRVEDIKRLKFIEENIKLLNVSSLKILDVGCGNGNISQHCGALGHEVLGIDISEKSIKKAKKNNLLKNVSFENIAVENIKYTSKFDIIICSEVLEHLEQPKKVVNALKKLLSSQGIIIITVPNGFGPRELLITKPVQYILNNNIISKKLLGRIKSIMGFKGTTIQSDADDLSHIQFFTQKSLNRLVTSELLINQKFKVTNFIEGVFPLSVIYKRCITLQKFDCWLADRLPRSFASGFMTSWKHLR
ncbi:class I SAM-dependent methyltransferase [Tenacibaculum sp. C7A-26P2]|uniref:class I SAM-dependent methyltransferase n=1 Tax=Tenacibaculum sp. C7A-26P2 TaxID=3447504 RepID=UPI003F84DF6E